MRNGEMVHYDSMLVIYAALLALTTLSGFASSFFLLIHVIFPLLRDPLLYALGKLRIIRGRSAYIRHFIFLGFLSSLTMQILSDYCRDASENTVVMHVTSNGVWRLCSYASFRVLRSSDWPSWKCC